VLALVVAAIGLYGVIGYDVAQRMHELGVRIALGAQTGDLIRLVVSQGVRVVLVGIGVGCLIAFVAGTQIQPLLFQQSARDPVVYGIVGGVLLVVALVACLAPARRAARADPNLALRSE
jgi:ABC-type antimicrobial peptide transport system permease subunit